MAKDPYHQHVASHVKGSRNPRAALSEAARSWGHGTQSNPSQNDDIVKLALVGVAAYVGLTWLHKHSKAQAVGVATPDAGCGSCGGDQQVHALSSVMTSAV